MASSRPALVGISHGTSSPDGRAAVAALMHRVAAAHPELTVARGFVDVERPNPRETLAALPDRRRAVVVPLLLSAGYHVHVDLSRAVAAETERPVTLAAALGPDDRLVALLRHRLDQAGLLDDDVLILAAAGSSDHRAVADCRVIAERLAAASGREVIIGFLSAVEPRLADAVGAARAAEPGRRIVVSSYLLAPGYFHSLAEQAGADVVTAPLLTAAEPAPELLVEVVASRYREAV
ncbi:sirohydrochlorin chelatase [Microterricola gilva]|nr:CbiX/SirB N-terminal domain-containing protein [Microterricola gilva]